MVRFFIINYPRGVARKTRNNGEKHMTEQPDNTQQPTPTESDTPSQAQNSDNHMIPKSRFDEVNNRAKELADRLDAIERERKEQETAQLQEQQKYKELYEQAQAELAQKQEIESEVNRFREGFQATLQARLDRIPEDKQGLVPDFDDPIKLSAWLDTAESWLLETPKPKAPNLNGGSGQTGTDSTQGSLNANVEGVAQLARQFGYDLNRDRLSERAKNPQKPTDLGE